MIIPGYNLNGFGSHHWSVAIEILVELGYKAIGVTLDHHTLNPYNPNTPQELNRLIALKQQHDLTLVIETGARYLLDRWQKHQPTLLSPEGTLQDKRIDFLCRCIDLAGKTDSPLVSLWSGAVATGESEDVCWSRLIAGLTQVLDYAAANQVVIAFEPEPGMLVATLDDFSRLRNELPHQSLQLTIDVGHLHCLQEGDIAQLIEQWGDHLVNVHLEDMKAGVHDHLPLGEGEMEFPPIINALQALPQSIPVCLELSRHGHIAPQMARESMEQLREWMN